MNNKHRSEFDMSRIPLKHGDTIQLNNRQYTIDSVIGDGATCIVYSAYYNDNIGLSHRVNIKECYPYNANITRNGQKLYWDSEEEKSESIVAFRNAYEKLMKCQNGNFTVHAFDICEANQTQYIVMDANAGVTFDIDTSASLSDILKTVRLLAYVIDNYHKNGYLHLDIKPSNFLVYPRPSEHIVLFDMDTVTLIDDISSGKVKCVSYSDGWAAPEQKQGRISKLCPATDIYAIGAVLFEKIMDRPVDAADMGIFADWDFDGELFEEVNPKIKRLLRGIFRKTLSANIKRRYQSANELIAVLDETIEIIRDGMPYIVPKEIYCSDIFVGRQSELLAIDNSFVKGRIVFVKGIHGIGKSELARKYALLHNKDYDNIVFCGFSETIEDTLANIDICNFEGSRNEHLKLLQRICDKNTLLIIDGVDNDNIDISILQQLKCHIIITTCFDWNEIEPNATVSVDALQKADQYELFIREYGDSISTAEESTVNEILSAVDGYTLLIPLIAKQICKWNMSLAEFLVNIHYDGIKSASKGKVRHLKDGNVISGTLYTILQQVLNLAELSEREIYVLKNLALLNQYTIEQKLFINLVGQEYVEQIDDLVFSGWLQRHKTNNETHLAMHTVISYMCFKEYKPTISNCTGIRDYVWNFACEFNSWHKNLLSEYWGGYAPTIVQGNIQYQFDSFTDLMYDMIKKSALSDNQSRQFWVRTIEKVSNVIYGDCEKFEPFLHDVFELDMESSKEIIPYITNAALAMEAIELQRNDIESALLYAKIAIQTLRSCPNVEEIAFRVCFNFYQYICCANAELEEYWTEPQFSEMAAFIKTLWSAIIENGEIEFEENDIGVLSEDDFYGSTMDIIEKAYDDFCWKISEEGIQRTTSMLYDTEEDYSDLITEANKVANTVCEQFGVDVSDVPHIDMSAQLTPEEIELGVRASHIQAQVQDMLHCDVTSMMGLWVVMTPTAFSNSQKERIRKSLYEIDPMLSYHCPSLDSRTQFLYELAKMEAAFSYAYAMTEDWERYNYHIENLLKYYKVIIYGKRYNALFRRSSIQEINSGLPGAATLLNQYGVVLPLKYALQFINSIVKIMENYHTDQHFGFDTLFEVYEMALKISEEAKDQSSISHYKKRISDISFVYFNKK